MNYPALLGGFSGGLVLGALFFGGLWLTVRTAAGKSDGRLIFLVSFILRTALVLGGFYLILMLGPVVLVAALVGFIVVRYVIVWQLK